ncbi:alpha-(1,3)-fucosyltransferase C-like [Tetranychus urticae]|uniref:Fucosyltransferase n=1 Tax=Tetranychus urticae TaxID=32264 RepID=T1K356_TETUR|nr:alpha-(1,3)-fucosyltransferase C-like [Tetranychus urticae]
MHVKAFSLKLPNLMRRFLILITFLCLVFLFYLKADLRLYQTKLSHPVFYTNKSVSTVDGLPVILLWNDYYEDPSWLGLAETVLPCGCLITRDPALLPQAKIVIFHWRNFDANDLPTKYAGQIWIWYHLESPTYTKRRQLLEQFQEHIDCWATYRQDSDFVLDYGRFERLTKPKKVQKVNVSSKKKYIAWMVSHCGAASGRDEFARQLSEYIPIDIYGQCGKLRCSEYSAYNNQDCWKMIASDYKFYLAFENSICDDYFTEKVIKPLDEYVIPLVLGGADYDRLLPNNSVINVRNFGSVRYLAMFLRSLAKDEERYNSYFAWKANYSAVLRIPNLYKDVMCDICSEIKGKNFEKSCRGQNENLVNWWFNDSICQNSAFRG